MSVLAPYCRGKAGLPIDTTAGPPTGQANQGLYALNGDVEAINNSQRDHASQGMPLNILSRLIVSPGATITYYDQGLPYSATGNIVTGVGPITYYNQGVGHNAAGEIVTT